MKQTILVEKKLMAPQHPHWLASFLLQVSNAGIHLWSWMVSKPTQVANSF